MKRSKLIKHLISCGCELTREGSRHSIWKNKVSGRLTAVPRHNEIKDILAKKICKDLSITKI
ncbi:MAG: addiction module toxin, HicA family [Spirochaetes bacterium]|nr:MAG: addiction module toxin, HicA family [Spirochaetota bacterium]